MVFTLKFTVDIVTFYCVKVCAFVLAVNDLHLVLYGEK